MVAISISPNNIYNFALNLHLTDRFSSDNFRLICQKLAANDAALRLVINTYGYPPIWIRKNNFESLIHIILEQQVSLASALAALNKLKEKLGKITPTALLALSDQEMKNCYFSRQKTIYVRALANAIVSKKLSLRGLEKLSNDYVRKTLLTIKGIGNWTVDIYLIFVLQRMDIFPARDLAAVTALKSLKNLLLQTTTEDTLNFTLRWKPYRSIATMVLWHYYLSVRKNKLRPLA